MAEQVEHTSSWFGQVLPRTSEAARGALTVAQVALDTVIIVMSSALAVAGREVLAFFPRAEQIDENVAPAALIIPVCWLLSLWAVGAYNQKSHGSGMVEYNRVMAGSLSTAAVLGVGAYLVQYDLSRGFYLLMFVTGVPLLMLGRFLLRRLVRQLHTRGKLMTHTIVAGAPDHVSDLLRILRRERWLGYDVIGVLLPAGNTVSTLHRCPVLGRPQDALAVIEATNVSAIIFAEGSFGRAVEFNRLARELEDTNAQTIVVPALVNISADRLITRPVAGIPLVFVERPQTARAGSWGKRFFDVVGSACLLVVFAPLLGIAALAIKYDDGGPVFFRQQRVGRGAKPFLCNKLRSMSVDAEQRRASLEQNNQCDETLFKMADDPRVTRVGKFLRRYSIDEVPQLLNVLRGEMSLVGPRPALPSEVDAYDEHVRRRLAVRPGMTGLWQVSGRSDLPWEDAVRLDLYYVDNWSMAQDVNILLRTFSAVLRARGAY